MADAGAKVQASSRRRDAASLKVKIDHVTMDTLHPTPYTLGLLPTAIHPRCHSPVCHPLK